MSTINILLDFSRTPGARIEQEGVNPGTDFREKILYPKLKDAIDKNQQLTIILDGTSGLGTSFLEESFGGLIRINKLKFADIKKTLKFVAEEDPDYVAEIFEYLEDARDNEK